jgi:Spy/CpxP family protein refolding chaperone
MKTKMISITLAWSFILLLTTLSLNAQQPMDNPSNDRKVTHEVPPPPPPPPPAVDADEPMPAPRLDLPDLTDEQKEKIKAIDLKSMEELTPLRNQVKEKTAKLQTVLTTQPFNEKEAFQLADEIGKIRSSMLKTGIRHDQELRKILTHDQQILFDARPKPFLNQKAMQPAKKSRR